MPSSNVMQCDLSLVCLAGKRRGGKPTNSYQLPIHPLSSCADNTCVGDWVAYDVHLMLDDSGIVSNESNGRHTNDVHFGLHVATCLEDDINSK
jgi:hypothetical protein